MGPKAAAPVATSGKTRDGGYFNLNIDGPLFDPGIDMTPIELSDWGYDDALAAGPAVWAGIDPVDELGSGYRFENMVAEQRQMAALYGGGEAAPVAANGQPYERPKVYAVSRDQMFEPIVGTPLPDMVVGSAARVAGSDGGFMNWIQSKDALSMGLDALPVVGTVKSIYQLYTGHDMVKPNEPVNPWLEGLGIVAGLIPGGKAGVRGITEVVSRKLHAFSGGAPALKGTDFSPDVVNLRSAEFYKLYGDNSLRGSMSNLEARQWYLAEDAKILNRIDPVSSLESQAKQAFDLRNTNRSQARELMADRVTADRLLREEPNMGWEQMRQLKQSRGIAGDDVYRSILQSSQKTRAEVNKRYGLD